MNNSELDINKMLDNICDDLLKNMLKIGFYQVLRSCKTANVFSKLDITTAATMALNDALELYKEDLKQTEADNEKK